MKNLLLLALGLAVALGEPCHEGWYYYNGACYGLGDTPMTWVDAEDICLFQNGKLAETETSDENEYLKNLLKTNQTRNIFWALSHTKPSPPGCPVPSAWLGGTDMFVEGNWTWMSTGQPFDNIFTDWAANQPNNAGPGEDCLLYWQSLDYQWADAPCYELHNFICEAMTTGGIIG